MSVVNCKTHDITQLTDQIYRVRVAPEQDELFEFKGGQYLFLVFPDGRRIPLSIASAPEEKSYIELHIRLTNEGGLVSDMLALFQSDDEYKIDGPHGRCYLQEGSSHVVIIAGGTGFSPMKSLIESALAKNDDRQISLYLGAQAAHELYQSPLIESWVVNPEKFAYVPVLGDPDNEWSGAVGFPHEVALENLGTQACHCDYYISGSEAMVVNVYKALIEAGVASEQVFSDILDIKRAQGELL